MECDVAFIATFIGTVLFFLAVGTHLIISTSRNSKWIGDAHSLAATKDASYSTRDISKENFNAALGRFYNIAEHNYMSCDPSQDFFWDRDAKAIRSYVNSLEALILRLRRRNVFAVSVIFFEIMRVMLS